MPTQLISPSKQLRSESGWLSYTSLSDKPAAETNAQEIFHCSNPGGASAFVGTIATLPGGATLTYNITSGNEGAMVPFMISHLAKMRIYNTTRGTSALISNCVTGTNTLTLTANVPAGWVVGDTITIASQTVIGGGFSWVDLEITSGLVGKKYLGIKVYIISATSGNACYIHPFASYSAANLVISPEVLVANRWGSDGSFTPIISNVFSLTWTGSPSEVLIRETGYLE